MLFEGVTSFSTSVVANCKSCREGSSHSEGLDIELTAHPTRSTSSRVALEWREANVLAGGSAGERFA